MIENGIVSPASEETGHPNTSGHPSVVIAAATGAVASPVIALAADVQDGDLAPDARTVQKIIILVAATTLLLVLAIMVLAIIRFSRNWRERIEASDSKPTPTSDIWSQHRLPDDVDSMLADDAEIDAESDSDDEDDDPERRE